MTKGDNKLACIIACLRNRTMNDQELVEFGEQFKQLSDSSKDLVYFPDTGGFELVPKRKISNGTNMDKKRI